MSILTLGSNLLTKCCFIAAVEGSVVVWDESWSRNLVIIGGAVRVFHREKDYPYLSMVVWSAVYLEGIRSFDLQESYIY